MLNVFVNGTVTLAVMEGYPFSCSIQVRWRDLDAFGHVNNAAFASYLEVARTEVWNRLFGGRSAMEIPFFVHRLEVEYRRPVTLDDEVVVWLRVVDIRGASFVFEYAVEAGREVAAVAVTRLACVDNRTGRPVRMTDDLRTTLQSLQT